ncbi:tRNA pseudouridine(38-40) synthase TruA [Aquibacillus salsiterrae]|uniref:tRNA pseudouridine synthase A n=1 Tax=Aquibacillus salsiterrae TaxID=2950439 RepID=A0A9X3WFQ7_9BACI|nr:tRNA pseudouridine(38-40) synthase TruA [Aquibacillus salsiterrae]MDC3417828.1 tRNA pseudouridine(38-40) synthase TruA [Aquibacillus salsiterrae]
MERIKCTFSYDGTDFSGYQIQPNGRTVQEEFEKTLMKMHKGTPVKVTASGRTDRGVHALGQVIHFDSYLSIPIENWQRALNAMLPDDIFVKEVHKVTGSFHARYGVIEKEYRYFIHNSKEPDVFKRNHTVFIGNELDILAMKQACEHIVGTHDFSSFCAANSGVKGDKIRTIYHVSCEKDVDTIMFRFKGSGFLYNMVRILVGTLLEVGRGERNPTDLKQILQAKDRSCAGKTAPPQGLYLWNVKYESD